jgi:hypothetical protein
LLLQLIILKLIIARLEEKNMNKGVVLSKAAVEQEELTIDLL